MRTAFSVSSAAALTSAVRSWALAGEAAHAPADDDERHHDHRDDDERQGGEPGLVTSRRTTPPSSSSRLRSAWVTLVAITAWMTLVSVVRRETTSPVRVTSKKPGGRRTRCA